MGKIRAAAVRLYCQPYSSVCLERMATAFHTSVPALESELAVLIAANKLQVGVLGLVWFWCGLVWFGCLFWWCGVVVVSE